MSPTDSAVTLALVRLKLSRILALVAQLRARLGEHEELDQIERDATNAIQELTERPPRDEYDRPAKRFED